MVSQYGRALAGQFFGHQHRDEFRVQLAAPLASSPPLYMFAALSPIQRTNPAYYRLDVDSTFKLLDVHSFFANISEVLSDFRPGYSARADFGLQALTNRRYENLARSFADGGDQLWEKFFAASVVENLGGECNAAQSLNPVVRLLLEARVHADTEDVSGRTPLLWASTHGHAEVVCLLLEAGADKDKVSHKGKSALARAARKGHAEVVRHLLEADAVAGDALLSALSSGHAEVVRMLLDATFSSESCEPDTKRKRISHTLV
ncbi:kidins220b [Symbiodinium microadriaticum]|nr:kidins220b [Symbiodinium microadriaticum]